MLQLVPPSCTINQQPAWWLILRWYCTEALSCNHLATSEVWCYHQGVFQCHTVYSLFQFRTIRWFKLAWSRSIWSIDAIGFCFARVNLRLVASVDVFFQDLATCGALTCPWSKEVFFILRCSAKLFHRSNTDSASGISLATTPCRRLGRAVHKIYLRVRFLFVPFQGKSCFQDLLWCWWNGGQVLLIGAKSLILATGRMEFRRHLRR